MITDKQKDTLMLTNRSKDIGEGWRKISEKLAPFIKEWVAGIPELVEFRNDDTGMLVRLTEEGNTVLTYL
jgi:hypothetical protein